VSGAQAGKLAENVIAAARYWRATQTKKGVPYQAIDHAHRVLAAAVDTYEGSPPEVEWQHPPDCECGPCWSESNVVRGPL